MHVFVYTSIYTIMCVFRYSISLPVYIYTHTTLRDRALSFWGFEIYTKNPFPRKRVVSPSVTKTRIYATVSGYKGPRCFFVFFFHPFRLTRLGSYTLSLWLFILCSVFCFHRVNNATRRLSRQSYDGNWIFGSFFFSVDLYIYHEPVPRPETDTSSKGKNIRTKYNINIPIIMLI